MISEKGLQKLRIASEKAKTQAQKQKLINKVQIYDKEVDQKINSVALNKFVIRKSNKLKELGKTKSEISEILIDLKLSFLEEKNGGKSSIRTKLSGFGIDKKYVGKSVSDILKSVNAYSEKLNMTPEKIKKEKLKIKINLDTVTENTISKTNEKIYDYLIKQGELDIANYILSLMEPKENSLKTSDINNSLKQTTEQIKNLSMINSGIYDELKKIREQQIDEQQTEIPIPERLEQEVKTQETKDIKKTSPEKKSGFLDVLKMIGVGGLTAFVQGIGLKLISKALKPISGAISLIKKILFPNIKLTKYISKMFNKMLSVLVSIPAIGKFFKSFTTIGGDSVKSKDLTKTEKLDKSGKPLKDKPEKISSRRGRPSSERKSVRKLSKSGVSKTGKIIPKLLKFTKAIPFLGAAIAAGSAVYSAYDGYNNADKILDTPKESLTEIHKIAAAAGAAVSDFLWPFSPDPSTTAGLFLKTAGAMGIDISPNKQTNETKEIVQNKPSYRGSGRSRRIQNIQNITNINNIEKEEKTQIIEPTKIPVSVDKTQIVEPTKVPVSVDKTERVEYLKQKHDGLVKKYGERKGNAVFNKLHSQEVKDLTGRENITKDDERIQILTAKKEQLFSKFGRIKGGKIFNKLYGKEMSSLNIKITDLTPNKTKNISQVENIEKSLVVSKSSYDRDRRGARSGTTLVNQTVGINSSNNNTESESVLNAFVF